MIAWFGVLTIAVALVGAVLCLVLGVRKVPPNDYSMGATVLVGLLLLAQIGISIAVPLGGGHARGDPLEFWMYLIVAALLPFGAGFWALMDRTRWANLVLAVVLLTVAVMVYRMFVIWG